MVDLKDILESDGKSNQTVSDVVKELITTDKNLSSKTELTVTQVIAFTKAESWCNRYYPKPDGESDKKLLPRLGENVIKYYKENLISLNRKGRTELVDALGKAMVHEAEMNRPKIQL